jgi:hypothetical protein
VASAGLRSCQPAAGTGRIIYLMVFVWQ